MNTQATEKINEQGAVQTTVDTVDYRSTAGQDKEPTKDKVGVVHLKRNERDSSSGGGLLSGAAAAVTNTFKSAKDAIMGDRGKDNSK